MFALTPVRYRSQGHSHFTGSELRLGDNDLPKDTRRLAFERIRIPNLYEVGHCDVVYLWLSKVPGSPLVLCSPAAIGGLLIWRCWNPPAGKADAPTTRFSASSELGVFSQLEH